MVLINIFAKSKKEIYVESFSNYYPRGGHRRKTDGVRMDCIYTKTRKSLSHDDERGFFNLIWELKI